MSIYINNNIIIIIIIIIIVIIIIIQKVNWLCFLCFSSCVYLSNECHFSEVHNSMEVRKSNTLLICTVISLKL